MVLYTRMILGVDTSSKRGSVALIISEDKQTADEIISESPASFSRTLLGMIDALLSKNGLTVRDFLMSKDCGVAVTTGPGSFTGIRIGVSTIQGMALASNIPVFGVSTLEAMAWAGQNATPDGPATMVMDAGKGNVYFADFSFAGGLPARISPDGFASISELTARGKSGYFCDKGDLNSMSPRFSGDCLPLKSSAATGAALCAGGLARAGAKGELASLASNYVQKSYAEKFSTHL